MYIGIDIGGTNTRVGLFQSLKKPDFTLITRFSTQQSYELQMHHLITALRSCRVATFDGIGISFGGRIQKDGRAVLVAPNLPAYEGMPLVQDFEKLFRCPVRLAHDTICGLLGEKKFGTLQDTDRCAYLTLSTGTGAAFQLHKANTTFTVSIEIGHQLLDGNTLHCLCGQQGCLETFTGGRQLEQRYGRSTAQITDLALWETFISKLALGLVNLTHLTRVEAIAIGGAIALNNNFLLPQLRLRVNELLRNAILDLQLAALGDDSSLVGAVTLFEVPDETIIH